MPEPMDISRAAARMMAETRHGPEYRKFMGIFKALTQAVEEEEKAGIHGGPANKKFMWYALANEAIAESEGHHYGYGPRPTTLKPPCQYCSEPSAEECAACREFFQRLDAKLRAANSARREP